MVHFCPAAHTMPQSPQLFSSTFVFAQVVPQSLPPPGQPHSDSLQICPEGHLLAQLPQLAGLFVMFVQSGGVPQPVVFGGHTQTPPVQT